MSQKIVLKFIFIGLLFYGCTLNEPVLPSWYTEFTIQLPSKTIDMTEIIDDSLFFADTVSGLPVIRFEITDTAETQQVTAEDLTFDDQTSDFSFSLESVIVEESGIVETTPVSIGRLLPPGVDSSAAILPPLPGRVVNLPPIEVEFDYFSEVEIDSGRLYLTIRNELFLGIDPNLSIDVFEDASNTLLGTVIFNQPVPPYSTVQSQPLDLAHKIFRNQLRLETTLPLAGTADTTHFNDSKRDDFFTITVELSECKVARVVGQVPAQNFTSQDIFDFDAGGHKISYARLESGVLNLQVVSTMNIAGRARITIDEIFKNQAPLVFDAEILPGQTTHKQIDLSNMIITNPAGSGFVETLHYSVEVEIDSSEGFVEITADDQVQVGLSTSNLIFGSFSGELSLVDIEFDPQEVNDVDVWDDVDGDFRLDDLEMEFVFKNQVDFPVNFDLRIEGFKGSSSVVVSLTDQQILASSVSPETKITLNSQSSTPSIVDLLALLPERIVISGNGRISGEGSVELGDEIGISYKIYSPLSLTINNNLSFDSAPDTLTNDDLDDDLRQGIREDFQYGLLRFQIVNHLPLGLTGKIFISRDRADLYTDVITDSSRKIIIEFGLEPAQTDAEGYASGSTENWINIDFDENYKSLFSEVPLYIRPEFNIQATGQTIRLRQNDAIDLSGILNFKFRMNHENK